MAILEILCNQMLCRQYYNTGYTVKDIAEASSLTPSKVRKYLRITGFIGKFRRKRDIPDIV